MKYPNKYDDIFRRKNLEYFINKYKEDFLRKLINSYGLHS